MFYLSSFTILFSVHKHSAGVGAGAGIVRVWPTLNSHISGALTLRHSEKKYSKNIRKIYFLIFLNFLKKEQFFSLLFTVKSDYSSVRDYRFFTTRGTY